MCAKKQKPKNKKISQDIIVALVFLFALFLMGSVSGYIFHFVFASVETKWLFI